MRRSPRPEGLGMCRAGRRSSLPEIRENFNFGAAKGPIFPIISSTINHLR
jgi:hypothetical protein